jgi:hypothetical protein
MFDMNIYVLWNKIKKNNIFFKHISNMIFTLCEKTFKKVHLSYLNDSLMWMSMLFEQFFKKKLKKYLYKELLITTQEMRKTKT